MAGLWHFEFEQILKQWESMKNAKMPKFEYLLFKNCDIRLKSCENKQIGGKLSVSVQTRKFSPEPLNTITSLCQLIKSLWD